MAALGKLVVSLALEYAQYTKGLDKSDQQSLKFAQNAQRSVDKASASFNNYASGAVRNVLGIGAAYLGVTSIIDKMFTSIDNLATLDDMSQRTGAATENLSKMQKVAKQFNFDFGAVDTLLVKLAKGMATVDGESNKTNKGLAALGIATRDAYGNLRDPSDVMIEAAKKLQNYQDGAAKVALIQDIMGKSAAEALPYMNDLAENVDKFAGDSSQAAAEAAALQDQIGGFKVITDEAFTLLATKAIPVLNDLMTSFIDNAREGGIFLGILKSIGDIEEYVLFGSQKQQRDNAIAALDRDIEQKMLALQSGTMRTDKGLVPLDDGAVDQLKMQIRKLALEKNDLLRQEERLKKDAASPYVSPNAGKAVLKYETGNDTSGDAAAKKVASTYDSLIGKSQDYVRNMNLELVAGEKLTEGQKQALDIREFLSENGTKLGKTEKDLLTTWLNQVVAVDNATQAQTARYERVAEWVDYQIQLNEATKAHTEGLAQATASYDSLVTSETDQLKSVQDQIDVMRFGTKATTEMQNARLLEAAAAFEQNAAYAAQNGVSAENIKSMTDRAQALRNLVAVRTELADKQVELDYLTKTKAFAEDTWRSIGDGLTDALFRGFERGENAGDNFFKRMKDLAKTTVLKFTTEFLIGPLKSMLNSVLMDVATVARNGSTSSGGIVDAVTGGSTPNVATPGIMAQGKNIWGALTGSIDKLNNAYFTGIAKFGQTISNAGFDKLGALVTQNSAMIGKVLPYSAAAFQLLQGDVKGAAFTAVGTAIGSIWGPVGAGIGSFVGNLVGGMFGSKKQPPRASAGGHASIDADGALSSNIYKTPGRNTLDTGIGGTLQSATGAFVQNLNSLLTSFGGQGVVSANATYGGRAKSSAFARFSANFDGESIDTGGIKYKKAFGEASLKEFIETILGPQLVAAIQKSKAIPEGVRALFNGMSDSTQVTNLINAVGSLNTASAGLSSQFGLTVDQAARVAAATGAVGDNLVTLVAGIGTLGQSYLTAGDLLQAAKSNLDKALDGAVMPATLKQYDAFLKGIDKTTAAGIDEFAKWFMVREQFAAFTTSLESLKDGVSGAVYSLMSDDEKIAEQRKQYLAMFSELGMTAPESAQELRARAASIDFTTKAGQDFAAMFPSIVEAFNAMQPAGNDLIAKFRGYAADLKAYAKSLTSGENALLSPKAAYDAAKANFEAVEAKVPSGDEEALASLQTVSQAFLEASKSFFASTGNYFVDRDRVLDIVNIGQVSASAKADVLSVTDLTAAVAAGTKDANAGLLAESKKQTAAAEAALVVAQAGYTQMLERLASMEVSMRKQANASLQTAASL